MCERKKKILKQIDEIIAEIKEA